MNLLNLVPIRTEAEQEELIDNTVAELTLPKITKFIYLLRKTARVSKPIQRPYLQVARVPLLA